MAPVSKKFYNHSVMQTWIFDSAHSSVSFAIRHIMISWVRGHVANVNGWLEFDPESGVLVQLEATMSVHDLCTGVPARDAHLKGPDFFDVQRWSSIAFQSKNIERRGALEHRITGALRMRGVEKDVTLDFHFLGGWRIPQKETNNLAMSVAFTGGTHIDRRDFGINWNADLPAGGMGLSNDVALTFDIEARAKHVGEDCPVCFG